MNHFKLKIPILLSLMPLVSSCMDNDKLSQNNMDKDDLSAISSIFECGNVEIAKKLKTKDKLVFNSFLEFDKYLRNSLTIDEYSILKSTSKKTINGLKGTLYDIEDIERELIINLEASLKEFIGASGEFNCSSEIFNIASEITENKEYNFSHPDFETLFEEKMIKENFIHRKNKFWLIAFIHLQK